MMVNITRLFCVEKKKRKIDSINLNLFCSTYLWDNAELHSNHDGAEGLAVFMGLHMCMEGDTAPHVWRFCNDQEPLTGLYMHNPHLGLEL